MAKPWLKVGDQVCYKIQYDKCSSRVYTNLAMDPSWFSNTEHLNGLIV